MIEKLATPGGEVPGELLGFGHGGFRDSPILSDCEIRAHTRARTLAPSGTGGPA